MIVTIDPGVREAGVAVWDCDGYLHEAYLVRVPDPYAVPWSMLAREVADQVVHTNEPVRGFALDVIVIERPQVYVHSRAKGDPNDLITLALAAGAIVGELRRLRPGAMVVEYRPAEWKGQVPKNVMVKRTKRSLGEEELDRVQIPKARSLTHNVWDAVGIGLYHLRSRRGQRGKTEMQQV
jgi:hypothetical protein